MSLTIIAIIILALCLFAGVAIFVFKNAMRIILICVVCAMAILLCAIIGNLCYFIHMLSCYLLRYLTLSLYQIVTLLLIH